MTPVQFKHWYTFSIRMAHRGWFRIPRKSRKRLAGDIKDFFDSAIKGNYGSDFIERIESWDDTRDGPPYVCDVVDQWEESWNPYYWEGGRRSKEWDDRWGLKVRCCLRVGLNLSTGSAPGVLGFTSADLHRMYRGKIPEWIKEQKFTDIDEQVLRFDDLPETAILLL
jgi:hypothetical protein